MGADSDLKSTSNIASTVEEEKEGENEATLDYFFEKIGKAIPVEPKGSPFDLQNPPSVPLAVSERFSAIFVAHSNGFYVAKTSDVLTSAKVSKKDGSSCSIHQLSIVNVSIGRADILALSAESSTLAASVGGVIYFFSVKSLLAQDPEPLFSCSIEPMHVKDICWSKQAETSFLILSKGKCLHRGTLKESLVQVMDDVDAVGWSVNKQYIAVARKNVLNILTPELEERRIISLELQLGVTDINNLRVDSIRWVRSDCIILGCFEQTLDGKEEDYLVRALMCRNGEEIANASSALFVVCFQELFFYLADEIMPSGFGPYLMASYLETHQLAVVAHRKNTDEHMMLIGWPPGGDGPAVVLIERDNWLPRIEIQENGDENLLLSLCSAQVSGSETFEVRVGNDELKELSPDEIIFCLTLDGKLTAFYFASASRDEDVKSASFISTDVPAVCASLNDVDGEKLALEKQSWNPCKSEEGSDDPDQVLSNQKAFHGDNSKLSVSVNETPKGENMAGHGEEILSDKPIVKAGNHLDMSTKKDEKLGCVEPEQEVNGCKEYPTTKSIDASIPEKAVSTSHASNTPRVQSFSDIGNKVSEQPTDQSNSLNKQDFKSAFTNLSPSHSPFSYPNAHGYSSVTKTEGNAREKTGVAASRFSISFTSSTSLPASAGQSSSVVEGFSKKPSEAQSTRLPSRSTVSGKHVDRSIHPSPSQHPLKPTVSKQYGNMEGMAKELDFLLDSIEVEGFRETCSDLQNNLEEELKALCDGSSTLQSTTTKQTEQIQHLMNNTVQVLARKTYMEGIVKQTTDKQYWDIWDRQKLTSELELKRQNMAHTSQDMLGQLVELKKYLNALEISCYGGNNEAKTGRQYFRNRAAPSRQHQSVQAVCNAMRSQLASAEQLSECLSRQMSVLSLTSPSPKVCIKDQLFEMMGMAQEGDTQGSLNIRNITDASENTTGSALSVSTVGKIECRNQENAMHNHEPETARRRRESLDRSWSNFEPLKTSIKRIVKKNEPVNAVRLSFGTASKADGSPTKSPWHDSSVSSRLETTATTRNSAHSPLDSTATSRNSVPSLLETTASSRNSAPSLLKTTAASRNYFSEVSASSSTTSSRFSVSSSVKDNSSLKAPSFLTQGFGSSPTPGFSSPPIQGFGSQPLTMHANESVPSGTKSFDLARTVPQSTAWASLDSLALGSRNSITSKPSEMTTSSSSVISSPMPFFGKSTLQKSAEEPKSHADKAGATFPNATCQSGEMRRPGNEPHSLDKNNGEGLGKSSEPKLGLKNMSSEVPSDQLSSTDVTSKTDMFSSFTLGSQADRLPLPSDNKDENRNVSKFSDLEPSEDQMDEEDISGSADLNLGSLGGLGTISDSSTPSSNAFKPNPFGGSVTGFTTSSNSVFSSPSSLTVPAGQLFRPASFSFQPLQSQPANTNAVSISSGGFNPASGAPVAPPSGATSGFGMPSQGNSGTQALGSVLGSFGQSRQLGAGGPVHNAIGGPPAGNGFAGVSASGGGFSGASATSGGFAGVGGGGGAFARLGGGSGGGFTGSSAGGFGFAGSGGGFGISGNTGGFATPAGAGGGFATPANAGGGFAAFGSTNQGENTFSAFGGGAKPPELFTQMRK